MSKVPVGEMLFIEDIPRSLSFIQRGHFKSSQKARVKAKQLSHVSLHSAVLGPALSLTGQTLLMA